MPSAKTMIDRMTGDPNLAVAVIKVRDPARPGYYTYAVVTPDLSEAGVGMGHIALALLEYVKGHPGALDDRLLAACKLMEEYVLNVRGGEVLPTIIPDDA